MSARAALLSLIAIVIGLALLKDGRRPSQGSGNVSAALIPTVPADEPRIVEDSMHEFMEYVFQPTYRRLKASMANEPADSKAWKPIKSDALILAESCNLLFMRKPDEDASDWAKHAAASRDDGAKLYKAARAKEFGAATDAWKNMLNNCNACHRQFEEGRHILSP